MSNRTWLHRGIAAAIGAAGLLALMGAKAVSDNHLEQEILARRAQATKKEVALYLERGDIRSAEARKALAGRQNRVAEKGLTPDDLDAFVGALHQGVDHLVVCRAVGVLIGLVRQGKLDAAQGERLKAEARGLFKHKEWLARCYGLKLTGELKDHAAYGGVANLARYDENGFVRTQAEKTLPLIEKP